MGASDYTASMPISVDLEGATIRRCTECYLKRNEQARIVEHELRTGERDYTEEEQ